jgi:hypothetical protein
MKGGSSTLLLALNGYSEQAKSNKNNTKHNLD